MGLSRSQSAQNVVVKGIVADRNTSERISGATIICDARSITTTDEKGYFSYPWQSGEYTIEILMLGYKNIKRTISIGTDEIALNLYIEMLQKPIEVDKVTIIGGTNTALFKIVPYELTSVEIKEIPKFVEDDPLRSVQTLPGVTTALSDFNSQIYLRGGNYDETLIALDGVPIFNPNHLGGMLSLINTDILGKEELYRSNYPVEWGDYLSGVLNMETKKGGGKTKGAVSLSLASLKGYVEGPLLTGAYTVSVRRFWLDALLSAANIKYYFYDLFGKYSIAIGNKDLLSVSSFYSSDVTDVFSEDVSVITKSIRKPVVWGNRLSHLVWTHTFDESMILDYSVYASSSFLSADEGKENLDRSVEKVLVDNNILEYGMHLDFCFHPLECEVKSGISAASQKLNYNWDILSEERYALLPYANSFFDFAPDVYSYSARARTISSYLSAAIPINNQFDLTLAYRASYAENLRILSGSPYVVAKYYIDPDINFFAGFGKYYQHLYTLKENKTTGSYYSQYTVYFVANTLNEVAYSDHFDVGFTAKNVPGHTSIEVECYYKSRNNISSTYQDILHPFRYEDGYSAGVDLLLNKTEGDLTGWLGYSFSRSIKEGNGFEYYSNADRTHAIKIAVNYRIEDWLKLSGFWNYSSGLPYTNVDGKYIGIDDSNPNHNNNIVSVAWLPIYGRKNGMRMEPYRRLDIGLTGYFVWGQFLVKPFFGLFNALNDANPFFLDWGSISASKKQTKSNIIPSAGVTIEF